MKKSAANVISLESQRNFSVILVGASSLYRNALELILNNQIRSKELESISLHGCSTLQDFESEFSDLSEPQRRSLIILLIDEGGEPASTIKNIDTLNKLSSRSKIIVVSNSKNTDYVNRCLEKGIDAYIHSQISEELLIDCVTLVSYGHMIFPSEIHPSNVEPVSQQTTSLSNAKGAKYIPGIDDEQAKILGCLASGMPNKEISRVMGLSDPATKLAVRKILNKIGAKNRVQAAVWAEQNGYFLDE
jgi:DNA-binding NarL/FixJ family response regulator